MHGTGRPPRRMACETGVVGHVAGAGGRGACARAHANVQLRHHNSLCCVCAMESAAGPPTTVLAFDPGLRNLAAVVLTRSSAAPGPDVMAFAAPDEPKESYRARGFAWFLAHGWHICHWDVLSIADTLSTSPKNVKRLSDATKVCALEETLRGVQALWFPAGTPPPTHVVVETQHNANAVMRGVAMSILMYFRHTWPTADISAVSGARKLGVCDAAGVPLGAGLDTVRRRSGRGRGRGRGGSVVAAGRDKYEDNKRRAVLAVRALLPGGHAVLDANAHKQDDLCDVLLMGLWCLWNETAWRLPTRSRKRVRVVDAGGL